MKRLVPFLLLFGIISHAHAVELATCRAPAGKTYFHYSGLTDKKEAGWSDDKISKGVFTLTQAADGALDVMYVDFRGKPISSTQDGAFVKQLTNGQTSVTVLVFYPTTSTEIYTFFREKDGVNKFSLLQSRSGDAAITPKSAVLVGACDDVRFDLLK